jgi:hypothetical protein
MRAGWIGVVVLGDSAIDGATDDRSETVALVARYGGGALWAAGVAAMAVLAVVSLTATRVIVPLSVPAALVAWLAGADPIDGALFLAIAVVTTLVAFSADIGRSFIQASAYGEEDRFPLRPPAAYALAAGLSWAMWAACIIAGPLLLASHRYIIGAVIAAVGGIGAVWAWPRWHRLARRWFVIVPIGIVIHDHLVLAETLMLRRHEIGALHLAPADTRAADLTGPAGGHAIEINTAAPMTAILAATPDNPQGTAIHLTAALVSPTRPGQVLTAAAERRLPVG